MFAWMEQAGNTGDGEVSNHQITTENSLYRRGGDSRKGKTLLFQRRHMITSWLEGVCSGRTLESVLLRVLLIHFAFWTFVSVLFCILPRTCVDIEMSSTS